MYGTFWYHTCTYTGVYTYLVSSMWKCMKPLHDTKPCIKDIAVITTEKQLLASGIVFPRCWPGFCWNKWSGNTQALQSMDSSRHLWLWLAYQPLGMMWNILWYNSCCYWTLWWRLLDGSSWLVSIIDHMIPTVDAMFTCIRLPSVHRCSEVMLLTSEASKSNQEAKKNT